MQDANEAARRVHYAGPGVRACSNCKLWVAGRIWHSGQCRRYPPTTIGGERLGTGLHVSTSFPTTGHDDWCGEFQE